MAVVAGVGVVCAAVVAAVRVGARGMAVSVVGMVVGVGPVYQVEVMLRGPESFGDVGVSGDVFLVVVASSFTHIASKQVLEGLVKVTVEKVV